MVAACFERSERVPTLQDKLAQGRFVLTAEITPPVSCDAGELIAKAEPFKGAGRCRQRHRRRRCAGAYGLGDGGGALACKMASSRSCN